MESNERPKLNLKSLQSQDSKNTHEAENSHTTESSKKFKSIQKDPKTKALIKS